MEAREKLIEERNKAFKEIRDRQVIINYQILRLTKVFEMVEKVEKKLRVSILLAYCFIELKDLSTKKYIIESQPITPSFPIGGVPAYIKYSNDPLAPYAPIWKWDN